MCVHVCAGDKEESRLRRGPEAVAWWQGPTGFRREKWWQRGKRLPAGAHVPACSWLLRRRVGWSETGNRVRDARRDPGRWQAPWNLWGFSRATQEAGSTGPVALDWTRGPRARGKPETTGDLAGKTEWFGGLAHQISKERERRAGLERRSQAWTLDILGFISEQVLTAWYLLSSTGIIVLSVGLASHWGNFPILVGVSSVFNNLL